MRAIGAQPVGRCQRIGALAQQPLDPQVDARDDVGIEAHPGHHGEMPRARRRAQPAGPEGDLRRAAQGGGDRGRVEFQADLARQHVGGAERDQPQRRRRAPLRPRLHQAVDRLVDGAVAAGRDRQLVRRHRGRQALGIAAA